MAIVIAGILGSGSPSFLHTQLFKPTELMNTYIPGFMVCSWMLYLLFDAKKLREGEGSYLLEIVLVQLVVYPCLCIFLLSFRVRNVYQRMSHTIWELNLHLMVCTTPTVNTMQQKIEACAPGIFIYFPG